MKSLSKLSRTDAPEFGTRAAILGELQGAGLHVPAGFAISADALRLHLEDATTEGTRPLLSVRLTDLLKSCCEELLGSGDYAVVRASPIDSAAGPQITNERHNTYYYISPQRLIERIIDCWLAMNPKPMHGSGGVILQRMINADSSGVAMHEPATQVLPERVRIEAIWGLGAGLSDGRSLPDRFDFTAQATPMLLSSRLGSKQFSLPPRLRNHQGARLESLPSSKQQRFCVSAHQAAEVAALAQRVSAHLGSLQTIDWACEGSRMWVLEAQPFNQTTTKAKPPGRWLLASALTRELGHAPVDPLTPLSADLYRRLLPTSLGQFINGHFYLNYDFLCKRLPALDTLVVEAQPNTQKESSGTLLPRVPTILWQLGRTYLTQGIGWHRANQPPSWWLRNRLDQMADANRSALDILALAFKRAGAIQSQAPFNTWIQSSALLKIVNSILMQGLTRWCSEPAHKLHSALALNRFATPQEWELTQAHRKGLLSAAQDIERDQSTSQSYLNAEIKRCNSPLKRWLLTRLISASRSLSNKQLMAHGQLTSIISAAQDTLTTLEHKLIYQGRLHCPQDAFFLHWKELNALSRGELQWRDVETRIRTRRRERLNTQRMRTPTTINLALDPPTLPLSSVYRQSQPTDPSVLVDDGAVAEAAVSI